IRLLGGRAYGLRLEMVKSVKEKKASVTLAWKPPQRAEEVIPSRNLSPQRAPELFVLTTPFPPDDRSAGYERGSSGSQAWSQAVSEASIETATYVAGHLRELAGIADKGGSRDAQARAFCERFAERAFRRPLTAEQKKLIVAQQFEGRDAETAVKRVVLLV